MEEKRKQSNRFYKGQEVSILVDISHFKMYGPGIYLFFDFVWKVSMLFLVMAIISIMPLTYNLMMGNSLSNSASTLQVVATRMSIGAFTYDSTDTLSNQHKLFNVIPDIVNSVIFLVFYFYWTEKSKKINNEIRK